MTKPRAPEEQRLTSGQAWQDLLAHLGAAGAVLDRPEISATPAMHAELYRGLLRLVRAMDLLLVEYADPERPILNRQFDLATAFAIDNPDTLYWMFPVQGEGTYLLRALPPEQAPPGERCRRLLAQAGIALDEARLRVACGPPTGRAYRPPHFLSLNAMAPRDGGLPVPGHTINNGNGTLEVAPDGSFEVLIGATTQPGNWLRLEPGIGRQTVFLRQTFADWENEAPLEVRLVRLDGRGALPRLDPADLAAKLEQVGLATLFQAQRWLQNTLDTRAELGPNALDTPRSRPDIAGLPGQYYAQGFFEVADDQALLVELEPPAPCFYWGLQLTSFFGESLDYANRQVSLNGAQAHVDADGRVRAVLAHRDPGVPNWLDVGGGDSPRQGLIVLRFTECGESPSFRAPTTALLGLGELRSRLPSGHPVVTPEARARELDARREHLARRLQQ